MLVGVAPLLNHFEPIRNISLQNMRVGIVVIVDARVGSSYRQGCSAAVPLPEMTSAPGQSSIVWELLTG